MINRLRYTFYTTVQFGFFHNLKSDFIMEVKKEYNKWIVLPAHILERMGVLVAESAPAWQDVRSTGNRVQIIC